MRFLDDIVCATWNFFFLDDGDNTARTRFEWDQRNNNESCKIMFFGAFVDKEGFFQQCLVSTQ